MNENKQLIDLTGEVLTEWEGRIGTHYDGCWKRHVACFAMLVKGALTEEGDTGPVR